MKFIFMLTRNDKTVAGAEIHLKTALEMGVLHIGFKDIGLPFEDLCKLNDSIKAGGATSYLEVVSSGKQSEINSAKAALDIGVDILLGGTHVDDVLPVLYGKNIKYYPFPGNIIGHPSVLTGSINDIVTSAKSIANKQGVDGLDLLAYRSDENVAKLMAAVCNAVKKPVIMAGSIERVSQIQAIKNAGAAGFTIGTAALDGKYPAHSKDLATQLNKIMNDVENL